MCAGSQIWQPFRVCFWTMSLLGKQASGVERKVGGGLKKRGHWICIYVDLVAGNLSTCGYEGAVAAVAGSSPLCRQEQWLWRIMGCIPCPQPILSSLHKAYLVALCAIYVCVWILPMKIIQIWPAVMEVKRINKPYLSTGHGVSASSITSFLFSFMISEN